MLQGIATQQIGVCLQQFAKIKALTLAPVMRGNILGKRAIVGQRVSSTRPKNQEQETVWMPVWVK